MRTNIVIDDNLMAEAMKATGLTTKRAVVEEALLRIVEIHRQTRLRKLRGRVRFKPDYDHRAMRRAK
ncbi:MAG: type II toxin-antitoxin system VapB family antitoxin [Phycisphaerae bacterium]|nr:type II toxin-antitoxin system VapB family antitoxin [Phycisphaerae bacterium]